MKIRILRKLILSSAAVVILIAISVMPLSAEFIFLKDGSIVEGKIISDAAASVTISTQDKKQKKILRSDIMRILYTKLNMSKIYIQKRDGKGIVAFIVDEDQETYTFRKELNSPDEFILKRIDVLFLADRNPSGLQVEGAPDTDRVSIFWLPPYDEVKKYNIYMKKNDKDMYELLDSESGKSYTIKNLTPGTTYYLTVKSVDRDNNESAPSNELKVKTKYLPPVITSSEESPDGGINIAWNEMKDQYGKALNYRVYGTKDKKREIISELKKAAYTLKDPDSYSRVEIAASDDQGDESEPVFFTNGTSRIYLEFDPGVIIPFDKLGEMYRPGYGGMINLTKRGLFLNDFKAGIGAGFYYLPGKNLLDESKPEYHRAMMAPLLLNTAYRINIADSFSFFPALSMGAAYLNITYMYKDTDIIIETGNHKKTETSKNFIDPMFTAGLGIEYRLTESFSISVLGEYGMFIERSGPLSFAIAGVGLNYRF